MIRVNWARKLVVGEEIMEKTATGLTWAKRAGKFLQWAGVIAEAALLIFSAVQGEKDRDTLRKYVYEPRIDCEALTNSPVPSSRHVRFVSGRRRSSYSSPSP